MKLVDADILSYALHENHIASRYVKHVIEEGLSGKLKIYVTTTTLLETYNTLYWFYKVRPRRDVALKISLVAYGLEVLSPSLDGFKMVVEDNVPLGDALLVATALENNISTIISNDHNIGKLYRKYGLEYENPIPDEVRKIWENSIESNEI